MANKRQWALRATLGLCFLIYCTQEFMSFLSSKSYQPQLFREALTRYEVEIVRDKFGVPAIFGGTDADVAFGVGYAMAEDRLEDIEEAIILYRAQRARYEGTKGLESDYIIRLLGIWDWIGKGAAQSQISSEVLTVLEAYASGVNAYAGIDVNRATASIYPLTVEDMLAGFYIQHLFFYGFDEQLERDLQSSFGTSLSSALSPDSEHIGSNAVALNAKISEDGDTYLFWNSHQPLRGPVSWYEASIHSEQGWTFQGGFFPGSPVPFIGVSPNISWGVTVNQPDLLDVFEVSKLHLDERDCWLDLKVFGALYLPVPKACYSFDGLPVLEVDDKFFAINYSGLGEFSQIEQWYRLSHAESIAQWLEIFEMQSIASFNFVAADRHGDIAFLHNALMPTKRGRFKWNEFRAAKLLPLVVNPDSGYVSSVNQSPSDLVDLTNNIDRQYFESHVNNRSLRVHEYMAEYAPIDWQEFISLKYDDKYSDRSEQREYLSNVLLRERNDANVEYVAMLDEWNGATSRENTHAALALCVIESSSDEVSVINRCGASLIDNFGRVDIPWGSISRLVDGGNYWAVSGAPDVLRAFYSSQVDLDEYGLRRVVAGDGLHGFVRYRDGRLIEALAISPYGQSIAKKSKHRIDQAQPFSNMELRSISFDRDVIYRNSVNIYRPSEAY